MKVVVHYSEIHLKKGNFRFFEEKLVENIKKSSEVQGIKIEKILRDDKRLVCDFVSRDKEKISDALKKVFGIRYFAFVDDLELNEEELKKYCERLFKRLFEQGISRIGFTTKRANKKFQLNSLEINKFLGEIANKEGLKIDYKNPEKNIFIEVTSSFYIYTERVEGFGGLPVGTAGKVLCLLSGGIDSVVAAWLMMKRGCEVDFLHFHTYRKNKEAEKGKSKKMVEKLNEFQFKSEINFIPYFVYVFSTQGKIKEKYDLILFKHYIMKCAERFIKDNSKKKYMGIVTGDNLAQVASQTIENISVTTKGIEFPIFQPLLTYNKEEIIDLSKNIGLYEISIEKYKDCCSILSKKTSLKTKQEEIEKEIKNINFEKLLEDSLKESNSLKFD